MSLCFLTNRFDFDDGISIEVTPIYKENTLVKIMANVFKDNHHNWIEIIPIEVFNSWRNKNNDLNPTPATTLASNLTIRKKIETYHELKKYSKDII